ncbi:MAG TPA: hypothetical protein VGG06_02735 [Thermoanaerobaculia bacterium]|jgi:hypothetical protein
MSDCVSEFYLHVCVKVDGSVESTKIEGPAPVAESSIPKEEFTFIELDGELEQKVFTILRRRYADLIAPNLNRSDAIYRPRELAEAIQQFPNAPLAEIVRLVDVRLQNFYMENVARGLKIDEFPTREGKAKVLRSTASLGSYVLRLLREAGELTQLES